MEQQNLKGRGKIKQEVELGRRRNDPWPERDPSIKNRFKVEFECVAWCNGGGV